MNIISHFLLALFSPALALLSLLWQATVKEVGQRTVNFSVILASISIALLNVTKVPESDLYNYLTYYEQAMRVGLGDYLADRDYRDPFFHLFSFVIARISGANHFVYVFGVTFAVYILYLKAVVNVGRFHGVPLSVVLILVIAAAFFGPSVSLSGHLFRQMLAGALVCYFLSTMDAPSPGKFNWVYLLFSLMTHIAVFLFLPVLIAKMYKGERYSKYKNVAGLLLVVIFSVFLFSSIGRALYSDSAFIGVMVARSATLDGANIQALSSLSLLIMLFTVLISAFVLYLKLKGNLLGDLPVIGSILNLYLIAFVLITFFLGGYEISSRYFFFVYMLMMTLLPLVLVGFSNKRLIALIVLIVSIASFYISVVDGVWQYEGLWLSLFLPLGLISM